MRCMESGWVQIGKSDSTGRRSLWVKLSDSNHIELCAGREGDDSYIMIDRSNPQFEELQEIMLTALYAVEG